MTKVLVTGGAGFVGSHVVDLLIDKGYDVVVIDNLITGFRKNVNPRAAFYELDIRDPERVPRLFETERFDYVCHHAAQMDVRKSLGDPLFDADVNIIGTLKLIELSKEFYVKRFVHVSSAAVYGEPKTLPCKETDEVKPLCQYGVSKHAVEKYLEVYNTLYNFQYTVFRYPNVFGARQNPKGEAGVIAIFAGKMLAGEPVEIHGDGTQTRDFVYVEDIAYANYLALCQRHPVGVYNLGSGKGTSVQEIYDVLADLTKYRYTADYVSGIIGETLHVYMDKTKVQRWLGWEKAITLYDGLEKTVNSLKGVI